MRQAPSDSNPKLIESAGNAIRFKHPENEPGVLIFTGEIHRALKQRCACTASLP